MQANELMLELAIDAGSAIMEIYAKPFEIYDKVDGSPVTEADRVAEGIILASLTKLFPDVPVVAEEAVEAGCLPEVGSRYFLVDPLDGTKEFLKKNGEFTVNIALVDDGVPVFGVVYAPALGEIFWGGTFPDDLVPGSCLEKAAYFAKVSDGSIGERMPISVRSAPAEGLTILASRSHLSEETQAFIDKLAVGERVSVGSSLKLCWVACGRADLYPRLAPTMQWDIAAGDAVVRAAGGQLVYASSLEPFKYHVPTGAQKDDLRNPYFIATSDVALLPRENQVA